MKDSDEILGGYNPITWNSNLPDRSFSTTKDSFIFSFRDKVNVLSRVKNEKRAIRYWSTCGPMFGNPDLILYGNNNGYYKITY